MPHNGARDRQWLARTWLPGARSAEGVMVRRLSVASLDSGAESPVYGEEPSASADRGPAEMPPRADGHGRWAARPNFPQARAGGGRATAGRKLAAGAAIGGPGGAIGVGGTTSLPVPRGGTVHDSTVPVGLATPGQVGTGVPRLATTCDMSVVDRQSGRWYVEDIRASNAADGNPMTWFASSWAARRGSRSPRKLTDVHGREG
jgi:hypothetical protein